MVNGEKLKCSYYNFILEQADKSCILYNYHYRTYCSYDNEIIKNAPQALPAGHLKYRLNLNYLPILEVNSSLDSS